MTPSLTPPAYVSKGYDVTEVTVFPPRSTDDEASAILDELSQLQSWCVLQYATPGAVQAADLVQRTRILIIERCKR